MIALLKNVDFVASRYVTVGDALVGFGFAPMVIRPAFNPPRDAAST
jgi:hypothetical protein